MSPLSAAPALTAAAAALRAAGLGARLACDAPLGARTTYRVGGPAALLLTPEAPAELTAAAAALAALAELPPLRVLGAGSNLLVADEGFAGLVVRLGDGFAGVEIDGVRVRAGGGAYLPVLARRSAAAGLTGFEWAVGVPGSLGGAVRMNAGGHGADLAASLVAVRALDLRSGEDERVAAADLGLGYRRCALRDEQVVVEAELALRPGERAAAEALVREIVAWRRAHQPGGQNAGSVFTNPPGDAAGRLRDAAGAKGVRVGSARVSEKHANFIIADEGGRAADVVALMRTVQALVRERLGVALTPETHLLGFAEGDGW
ncbi:MAG: UDP-N-acetylmuramate dehydrogenase [Acidimicrobiales bacterium]